ncbi:protein of unknown function [Methanoculleus bourgensis]|uniref:Uncharacterized protein n=1 Tax=Methanoculleus bourgensis TaxID=83986 RepID=A0A110BIH8_9EURY|nr:protein of unknown function [Methanoculleus bourgensis]
MMIAMTPMIVWKPPSHVPNFSRYAPRAGITWNAPVRRMTPTRKATIPCSEKIPSSPRIIMMIPMITWKPPRNLPAFSRKPPRTGRAPIIPAHNTSPPIMFIIAVIATILPPLYLFTPFVINSLLLKKSILVAFGVNLTDINASFLNRSCLLGLRKTTPYETPAPRTESILGLFQPAMRARNEPGQRTSR